jgi:hypothetical protein
MPPTRRVGLIGRVFVLCLLSAACTSTPKPRARVFFPFWSVREAAPQRIGCAELLVWISKSGKEGLGASVRVRAPEQACSIQIVDAALDLPTERVLADTLPPERTLPKGAIAKTYLAFPFDNEASWTRGEALASLVFRVVVQGEAREVRRGLYHRQYSFLGERAPAPPQGVTIQKLDLKHVRPPGSTPILKPPAPPTPPPPPAPNPPPVEPPPLAPPATPDSVAEPVPPVTQSPGATP